MKRIRYLGLGVAMALALFALPASASAAGGVVANSYPVTYVGSEFDNPKFTVVGAEGQTECFQSAIWGEAKGPSSIMGSLAGMKCGGTQLSMNGCKFEFHPGSENSFDIGPPGCGPITGLIVPGCKPSIVPQTNVPATFENIVSEGLEKVRVKVSTSLQQTGCASALLFSGGWVVGGSNAISGEPVNIRSVDSFTGFFVAGKKSESVAEQPRFAAEKYPLQLAGGLNSGTTFTFKGSGLNPVKCSIAQFSSELSKASTSLSVGAAFSQCKIEEDSMTVKVQMNSCKLALNVLNSGPPYVGGAGIACAKEGDAIELIIAEGNFCLAKFPSQTLANSVTYANQGIGSTRTVSVGMTAEKVTHTYEKGFCLLLGKNHSSGVLSGSFRLGER